MAEGLEAIAPDLVNPGGAGPVVIVCEHASAALPAALGDLGLAPAARHAHIAWDPGALGVARGLAEILDAPLVAGAVSRLVHDCNRPPGAPDAVPARVEVFDIPGNAGLGAAERAARAAAVYAPFHDALARLLAARPRPLVTVHSFTPVWHGRARAVELGILHDADARLADAMLAAAPHHTAWDVRRNEPYGPADGVTHTLIRHGLANGLANVMIEIRNDLIASPAAEAAAAAMLAGLVRVALAALAVEGGAA